MGRRKSRKHARTEASVSTSDSAGRGVAAPRSGWILNPVWDSVLFIGAPVVVIAGFLPLRSFISSEQIAILSLAFFTFGHHFPTFLRAYGDAELFRRFRTRFLLAPPLLFAAALWFDSRSLHGLLLFVAAWDIWHVLMQHYGFMRIYDSKAGAVRPLTSRLDWAFSISCYVTLIALSPHYSHNMLSRAYQSGLPLLSAEVVNGVRMGLTSLTALLTFAYVGYHLNLWRTGKPVSLKKLALLGIFLAATYYLYVEIEDFLVGFTVWSAFHCIQYYGIVWAFNRNRVDRRSPVTAFVRFLFRPSWALVVLYTALIFAYGSINLVPNFLDDPMLRRLLMALIFTSNALHYYYYDGFIWKVREPETRRYLGISAVGEAGRRSLAAASASMKRAVGKLQPARKGLVQAAYLAAIIVTLASLEIWRSPSEVAMTQSLVAAAPDVGTAHYNHGNALWRQGDIDEAIGEYQRAADLMPDSSKIYNNWGAVLAAKGDFEAAIEYYETALALRREESPGSEATSRSPLLPGSAHSTEASLPLIHTNLGDTLARLGRSEEALSHYQKGLALEPWSAKIQASVGATLADLGRYEEGVRELQQALVLDPYYATGHINLASLLVHIGREDEARRHYESALRSGDHRAKQAAQAALQELGAAP